MVEAKRRSAPIKISAWANLQRIVGNAFLEKLLIRDEVKASWWNPEDDLARYYIARCESAEAVRRRFDGDRSGTSRHTARDKREIITLLVRRAIHAFKSRIAS